MKTRRFALIALAIAAVVVAACGYDVREKTTAPEEIPDLFFLEVRTTAGSPPESVGYIDLTMTEKKTLRTEHWLNGASGVTTGIKWPDDPKPRTFRFVAFDTASTGKDLEDFDDDMTPTCSDEKKKIDGIEYLVRTCRFAVNLKIARGNR